MRRGPLPLLVLALSLVAMLQAAPATAAPEPRSAEPTPRPRASLADIEDEVMCPVCGVPLELAIEAPQADAQRDFIRRMIAEGRTEDEIKEALVAEYGEEVLAVPGDEGFDLAAWLVPVAGFVIAVGAIGVGIRRWRARGTREDAISDAAPSTEPKARDSERLEADLARYDL